MKRLSVRLVFPPSLQNEPVLFRFMRHFDFSVNVLRANISPDEGWIDLEINGRPEEIEGGLIWLKDQGVTLEKLTD